MPTHPSIAPPSESTWEARYHHDELWLKTRRVLRRSLGLGYELDDPEGPFSDWIDEQLAVGTELRDRIVGRLDVSARAALGSEGIGVPRRRRFAARQPLILAFLAELADVLVDVGEMPEHRAVLRELSAMLNLGVVLVDMVTDDPELHGRFDELLTPDQLLGLIGGDDVGLPDAGGTEEVVALRSIVLAFFDGVRPYVRSASADVVADYRTRLLAAYHGQLASAGTERDVDTLRNKSVGVFTVVPSLARLVHGDSPRRSALDEIAECAGEVFWRVDDLVDISHDWAVGDGNIVLERVDRRVTGDDDILPALLSGDLLEEVAAEAAEYHDRALAAASTASTRARLSRWFDTYTLDWMR